MKTFDGSGRLLTDTQRPVVTSLPSPATDGQEIYYLADAANGIVWHLRYRAASASPYKWECIAGRALVAEITSEQSTSSGAYTDLATVGPSIVAPLAGDYEISVGAHMRGVNMNNLAQVMSYAIGATGASDADAARFVQSSSGTLGEAEQDRLRRKTGLLANSNVVAKYWGDPAGTAYYSKRRLSLLPIRVG